MMKHDSFPILGLEGGGTKTTWALVDAAGQMIRNGKSTAGNVQHLSDADLRAMLQIIRKEVGPNIHAVGGAFAGCHLLPERKRVEAQVRLLWPHVEKVVIGEDTRSAFAGSHGNGDGLIVIAGTGANVQGHCQGRWEKAAGWGSLFSDPGSGYDIARRGLETVYAHYDRTGKVTSLGQAFLQRSGQNCLPDLVPWVMERSSKTEVADLVPCVFAAAKAGDRLAKDLIAERVSVLAEAAFYIVKRLGLQKPNIGLVGSLFEKEPTYFAQFERAARKRFKAGKIFVNTTPGAVGAARFVGAPISSKVPASSATAVKNSHGKNSEISTKPVSFASATTEERNPRSARLDRKSVAELVDLFISEERYVQEALRTAQPQLVAAATRIANALRKQRRLFYVGAGTSGRLGVLDASEMPPTFNVSPEWIQGIIAGGFSALLRAQEGAEDNAEAGAVAIRERGVTKGDVVLGITASGSAPFVRGALAEARRLGAAGLLLTCNPRHEPMRGLQETIVLPTGPELVTGSTRLKAGTVTKLALNLFSTIAMIRCGRVKDNLMVNVQPTNQKLKDRALRLVMTLSEVDATEARARLDRNGWDVARAAEEKGKKAGGKRRKPQS